MIRCLENVQSLHAKSQVHKRNPRTSETSAISPLGGYIPYTQPICVQRQHRLQRRITLKTAVSFLAVLQKLA